jgi:hypothetical protein
MDRIKTARQAVFLRRLTDAKNRLLHSIAGLDQATLCTEPVAGDWTAKDILGHVVSWDREFRVDIGMILRGKHPGYDHRILSDEDYNRWNQRCAAQKRRWTWRRIRADLDRDFREASILILRLQPGDFRKRGVTPWKCAATEKPAAPSPADTDSVATLITFHWRHIHQHARMLESWRRRRVRRRLPRK